MFINKIVIYYILLYLGNMFFFCGVCRLEGLMRMRSPRPTVGGRGLLAVNILMLATILNFTVRLLPV